VAGAEVGGAHVTGVDLTPDKPARCRQAHRVLRPGSRFVVYDVVSGPGGAVHYPVPWARDSSTSFSASMAEMPELLAAAGFTVLEQVDSSTESVAWFEAVAARLAESSPPPSARPEPTFQQSME
jgi:hypothetical protein